MPTPSYSLIVPVDARARCRQALCSELAQLWELAAQVGSSGPFIEKGVALRTTQLKIVGRPSALAHGGTEEGDRP